MIPALGVLKIERAKIDCVRLVIVNAAKPDTDETLSPYVLAAEIDLSISPSLKSEPISQ
jgi:hypothetical protein